MMMSRAVDGDDKKSHDEIMMTMKRMLRMKLVRPARIACSLLFALWLHEST